MKGFYQTKAYLLFFYLLSAVVLNADYSPGKEEACEVKESDFKDVAKGSNYSIGLKADGTVWGRGDNSHGQLGAGKTEDFIAEDHSVEMQTGSGPLTQVTAIACNNDIAYALCTDGTVWRAGGNTSGLAEQVSELSKITSFSTQNGEFLFGKADGNFYRVDGTPWQSFNNGGLSQASETPLLSSATSVSQFPDSWQLQYFGHTGVDANALAANGSKKTILQCYLDGSDPSEAAPEEPFTVSLSLEGPYRATSNITVVANVMHSKVTDISKVEFYCQGQCLATNTEKPYEFTANCTQGQFLIEAIAYDSSGKTARATEVITVDPCNWYSRGLGFDPKYKSSIIAIDQERGVFLDKINDFNTIYRAFPWFLRIDSEVKDCCSHIMVDPANPNYAGKEVVNTIPQINGVNVGGQPPMVAFGSQGGGSSLYVNQYYHFGIISGIPLFKNGLKLEIYDKDDFVAGKTNVQPVMVKLYDLPSPSNSNDWKDFYSNGHVKEIHLKENIHGKVADFETQLQYVLGNSEVSWGCSPPFYPLIVTHRAGNNNFYFKVSIQGETVNPSNPLERIPMSIPSNNISYSLDFEDTPNWGYTILNNPHFQGVLMPDEYQEKSIDELIHQTPLVSDTLLTLEGSGFTKEQLTQVNNSPELKSHSELEELSNKLGKDPMVIANYVQNEIEITDAIGANASGNSNDYSLNSQGVIRDALATYMEGQGSPIEQCGLLIYLLRKAGYPAAYVFPEHNSTLMFDEELSKMLHMQIRGTRSLLGESYLPELIPVNYPWVTSYIDGKWVHLFPWIKDTEVREGKDVLDYFPEGYQKMEEWLYHYLLNDQTIRGLSEHGKEDNAGTLFKMYAQKILKQENLTLKDVGINFKNRPHYYTNWADFPKPWKTATINKENIAQNLDAAQNPNLIDKLKNIFNTISIQVISDRNNNGIADPGEPMLETGEMKLIDLHSRRLLLYHQLIPDSSPAKYNMILSLEPYDTKDTNTTTYTFNQGEKADPGDLRSPQKISTILQTTENTRDIKNDDSLLYKITTKYHRQLEGVKLGDYYSQFPSLEEQVGTSEITRPLRKGDMAALSINYGRVSQRMMDFEIQKYKSYKQECSAHPDAPRDPEQLTGQILQSMGQSYYFKVSSMGEELENLLKAHTISWKAYGLSKLSPERDNDGSPVITADGKDFNLVYPRVDMSYSKTAAVGNQTSHLDSGESGLRAADLMKLILVDGSAQEHRVINECFNQDNAISTIKLLDIAQGWTPETGVAASPGKGVVILDHNNYQSVKGDHPKTGNPKIDSCTIEEWGKRGGIWRSVENIFSKDEDWLNIVFINDSPQVAPAQNGKGYVGIGGLIFSPNACSALISDSLSIDNGGYGGSTTPISSCNPDNNNSFTHWIEVPPPAIVIPAAPIYNYPDLFTQTPSYSPYDLSNLNKTEPIQQPNLTNDNNFNQWVKQSNEDKMWQQINKELHSSTGSAAPYVPASNNSSPKVEPTPALTAEPTPAPTGESTPVGGAVIPPVLEPTPVPIAVPETAATPLPLSEIEKLKKEVSNNGFIGVPTYYGKLLNHVMDPVSVVTGEFYINDVDLKLNGPMPLEIRRSYGSQNRANNNFGYGWKLSYFPYLMVSADSTITPNLIHAAEPDGSVIAYRYQADQKNWAPTATDNPDLINGSDGTTLSSPNLFNNRITQTTASDGTAIYALKGSDGSTRTFKTKSFPVIGDSTLTRTRPYLDTWSDTNGNSCSFNYGSNNTASDWGQLNLIQSNNGTSLRLKYDLYGHINEIFSSDGRRVIYTYDRVNNLVKVTHPDNSITCYSYEKETHLLTEETKPDSRILKNQYDESQRVIVQLSTTGESPEPIQSATFNYATTTNGDKTISGTTTVTDVNGNPTSYTLSSSQITQINYPNNTSISQTWDPVSRSLTSRTDRRGLVTAFSYDAQGNLTSRSISGNLTGKGSSETAITSMSYNALNALTGVTDPLGNKTSYSYSDTAHPYQPTSITQSIDNSSTKLSYGAYGLLTSQVTTANNSATSETDYTYNKQGYLSSMTQKTGTSDADLTLQFTSNNRGEIVSSTDQSGAKTSYDYDAMGRRTSKEVFDPNGSLIDWHFTYYNENGDVEWEQGARFNPTDKTYYDYDFAGHLHHKMTWLSAALGQSYVTDGGQATTTYEHDNYGNVTQLTDANGHVTTMTYDQVGNMLTRVSGDKTTTASESFTYEAGGLVATHQTLLGGKESNSYTSIGLLQSATHADGTSTSYVYDLLGRVVQETFPSGLTCNISYNDASGTLTRSYSDSASETEVHDVRGNIVAFTDRVGNKFTSSFDALGRIKNITGPASGSPAQSALHVYDPKKNCESIVNGLNETTNIFHDALGRSTLTTIFNSDGSVAKNTAYWYSGDHQSSTIYEGTGSNAIATTIFTDLQNRPLIVQHADGSTQITRYDAMGNKTSFTDEGGVTTTWSYDALNHLASETRSGGATINYSYNAAGELVSRAMPAGLTEKNSYNEAGQKTSDELDGSDGSVTRNHGYSYANGQVTAITDPRGFTTAINYDAFGRPLKVTSSGAAVPEQNQTTAYQYDPRGLLTSVSQNNNASQTLVTRGYDAYGQLLNETTSLNGTNVSAWTQAWNGAGRRTGLTWTLDHQGPQYSFSYNALGLMTSASNASGNCSYGYADNGLLSSRENPQATVSITRNSSGNVADETIQTKQGATLFSDHLDWYNSRYIKAYAVLDNELNLPQETRTYGYDGRGRIIQEPYAMFNSANESVLPNGQQTAIYLFDETPLASGNAIATGLGVRTRQFINASVQNCVPSEDQFSRVKQDNNFPGDGNGYGWISSYDQQGEVTNRSKYGFNDQQNLSWDSFGHLVKVTMTGSPTDYSSSTIYDGLGRRLQTSMQGSTPSIINYYNDPEVEFLELGHDNFGRTWNLYGPDRSGTYGGAQGIGGLESTYTLANGTSTGIVNNYFGDAVGIISGGAFTGYNSVLGGYGPMPGSSVNQNLTPQWRGHYLDPTGFYYMGARYYEPNSGRFLSADPLGHDASLSLYDYCNGDPVNGLDPDGRCVEKGREAVHNAEENISYSWNQAENQSDADIGARILAGIPVSILSGDAFTRYTTPDDYLALYGHMPMAFSANGIFANEQAIINIRSATASGFGLEREQVFSIQNPSYGPLDLIRAAGQGSGAIDITALRAADMINAAGGGIFIAHSNGSALFYAASALLRPEVKANITYKGYGPQININAANDPGLRSYYNDAGSNDLVARWLNPNAHWDRVIPQSPFHPLNNHGFKETYASEVY